MLQSWIGCQCLLLRDSADAIGSTRRVRNALGGLTPSLPNHREHHGKDGKNSQCDQRSRRAAYVGEQRVGPGSAGQRHQCHEERECDDACALKHAADKAECAQRAALGFWRCRQVGVSLEDAVCLGHHEGRYAGIITIDDAV